MVQSELWRMYNTGVINREQMVEKLKELKCILKIIDRV